MIVLHIGLGKTASTSLQKHAFPKLAAMRGISFNNPGAVMLLRKHQDIGLNTEEITQAEQMFAPSNNMLISDEGLVNWNPHRWEESADEILALTGSKAVIIITVREPLRYLTSMYQQTVHLGEVRRPHDFFTDRETYEKLKNFRRPGVRGDIDYFDADSFDLERLEAVYTSRFDSVYIVPMERLGGMNFLSEIYRLNSREQRILRDVFKNAPQENRAFSQRGMELTFMREDILNVFGLRSEGKSRTGSLRSRLWLHDEHLPPAKREFKTLSAKDKIRQFFPRAAARLIVRWENFIRNGVDRIFPHLPYELPGHVYVNNQLIEKNREYLRQLKNEKVK